MADWSTTFKSEKLYIGYFPGAGGNRFRRQVLGLPWQHNTGDHLHAYHRDQSHVTTDEGVPKFPKSWVIDHPRDFQVTLPIPFDDHRFVVISHGMHLPSVRHTFPGRKLIKIYANLRDSLRRWWVVFGKKWSGEMYPTNSVSIPVLGDSPMTGLEAAIKTHVDYYTRFFDCCHDHAVYISPGESEFADFMLEDFEKAKQHHDSVEFDEAWNSIACQGPWVELIRSPYLLDPEFCRKQCKYLDYPMQQA